MNIQEFSQHRPYLYHLTDEENLPLILGGKSLKSTELLAYAAFKNKTEAKEFLRTKRVGHAALTIDTKKFKIRDQLPISLVVLERSLADGLNSGDFLELLNSRVFWWPTKNRLERHFKRYESENPVIIKVITQEMLDINNNVEFCRLNSGATRCHPAYGGNAPTRGKTTFLPPDLYQLNYASIAEVTFPKECNLPSNIWIGSTPEGPWKKIN
jgi:hypothetical protein